MAHPKHDVWANSPWHRQFTDEENEALEAADQHTVRMWALITFMEKGKEHHMYEHYKKEAGDGWAKRIEEVCPTTYEQRRMLEKESIEIMKPFMQNFPKDVTIL